MTRVSRFVVLGAVALALAIPAMAASGDPIQGFVAAGFSEPLGTASDSLNGGWNFSGGAIWRPSPGRGLGIKAELGYDRWDATRAGINNAAGPASAFIDGGYASMWRGTIDAIWQFGQPHKFGGYIGAGIGGYRRYAALTNDVLVPGTICDPYWGYCYDAVTTGSQIVADDSLTKFGYNATAGVIFPVGPGDMYVEATYHYMDTTDGTEFIPIVIGYRF